MSYAPQHLDPALDSITCARPPPVRRLVNTQVEKRHKKGDKCVLRYRHSRGIILDRNGRRAGRPGTLLVLCHYDCTVMPLKHAAGRSSASSRGAGKNSWATDGRTGGGVVL